MSNDHSDDLVGRVNELEQEVSRLRAEIATTAGVAPIEPDKGPVSRRDFFAKAGLVAAGAGVASLASIVEAAPAAAEVGTMLYGSSNNAVDATTVLVSTNVGGTLWTLNSGSGEGLVGRNDAAAAAGVRGNVLAEAGGNAPGVLGTANNLNSQGVKGDVTNPGNNSAAIWGHTVGGGSAVYGQSEGNATGVFGDAVASARGVWGRHSGSGSSGIGVFGESQSGRGGQFKGKAAQVRLQPSNMQTHPTSGQKGDLFVDASGRLWFCNGTTTWSQVA